MRRKRIIGLTGFVALQSGRRCVIVPISVCCPYVLVNASSVLTEEEFREWIKTIRPEVVKDYEYKRMYWHERYSTLLGEVQNKIYNLFLKGNNIPSGRKNYAEVIGILLSLEEK